MCEFAEPPAQNSIMSIFQSNKFTMYKMKMMMMKKKKKEWKNFQ